jgi:hypothetical protein
VVPSRSPGSLEERDFCLQEKPQTKIGKPVVWMKRMSKRSQAAEAPLVSDSVYEKWTVRDRAVVSAGWEPVAAARPGLLALLLS